MIKFIALSIAGDRALDPSFSDAASVRWHAEDIIARDTEMTRPLTDPKYFARVFIEGGALAWPNGLEFSPEALHRKLDASVALCGKAA